jgi:hypothetical protein
MVELKKGDKVVPVNPRIFNEFYYWPQLPEFFVLDKLPEKDSDGQSYRLIDPRFAAGSFMSAHWAHMSLVKSRS